MKNKIPPPVILVCYLVLVGLCGDMSALSQFELDWLVAHWQVTVGALLIVGGVALDISAFLLFRQIRTTINPLKPENATRLVVSGPNRLSRNPMYLGMAIALTGWIFIVNFPFGGIFLVLFVVTINKLQIEPEEKALRKNFGDEYDQYLARVGRWLWFVR